jgi:hypothetical protein
MIDWPTSGWKQAAFSVAAAITSAIFVGSHVYNAQLHRFAAEYPLNHQEMMGIMLDTCEVSGLTLIGVFFVVFVLQRAFFRRKVRASHRRA